MSVSTRWTPTTHADYDALKGRDVISADGEKVGSISEILHPNMEMPQARGRHYFLLDPGLLKDWFGGLDKAYLPEASIDQISPDRVVLNLRSDQIKQRSKEWSREPASLDTYRRA